MIYDGKMLKFICLLSDLVVFLKDLVRLVSIAYVLLDIIESQRTLIVYVFI